MKKNIALIGESPNDTNAIKYLLQQKYNDQHIYVSLLDNIRGSHLDSPKAIKAFGIAIKLHQPDYVIFIRDSDSFEADKKVQARIEWHKGICKQNNYTKSILLLNIQAIEALILADIDVLKRHYNIQVKYTKDVMLQEKPKEELKTQTNQVYKESHCLELFQKVDINVVMKKCKYFKSFITDLGKALSN